MTRVRFGEFEADLSSGELWRSGVSVPVQDLPFRLLVALVERPGEIVTRDELVKRLWASDTFVDAAAGLNTAVAKLRDALRDDSEHPRFIETVPKRGYRFVGAVNRADATAARGGLRRRAGRHVAWLAAGVALVAAVGLAAAYRLAAKDSRPRVAVVLFDNETGRPELAGMAQNLTDATVTALAAEARLAVIGNAAVLRTPRPFRDIAAVRDALDADFIVIGQLQRRDDETIVRAHLIRADDQSHVWVDAVPMTAGEAALQSDVAARIRRALARHALNQLDAPTRSAPDR